MSGGFRRDRIRVLGNAVCPPVMEAVVRHLAGTARDSLAATPQASDDRVLEELEADVAKTGAERRRRMGRGS